MESKPNWLYWLPSIVLMALIFSFSSAPGDDLPDFGLWDLIVKKGAHMAGYALLSLSYLHGLTRASCARRRHILLAIILSALYAASDEIHQLYTPGRGPRLSDVGIDAVGAAAAALSRNSIFRRLNLLRKAG